MCAQLRGTVLSRWWLSRHADGFRRIVRGAAGVAVPEQKYGHPLGFEQPIDRSARLAPQPLELHQGLSEPARVRLIRSMCSSCG